MRVVKTEGDFRAKAIAGTYSVLIALDCAEARRHGLMGFAFRREVIGANFGPKWLRSQKVFKSIVPDPKNARDPHDPTKPARFSTWEHPIQSFLWGDYTAAPDTLYKFTVVPMYGHPGALQPQPGLAFEIRTEKELDRGHGIWFNRGAIASQVFAREFGNKAPSEKEVNDPQARETAWLSRGLLDACLRFINDTPAGDGLRVAAYEFTYKPVLDALKSALDRGVDVRIVYHGTTGAKGANENAIEKTGLPRKVGRKQVLFARTKTKIPHNKFIVRLEGGTEPTMVWTGSTNLTPSGFLGQSNVGHLVVDPTTAKQYLAYWQLLKKDPEREMARIGAMKLTQNPPTLIPPNAIARVFSPRSKSELLNWYGSRIEDAVGTVMFTAAFGVTKALVGPLAKDRDFLRFILMEKPPGEKLKLELTKDRDCVISYGAVLGEMYTFKDGEPVARKKIKEFELDKWLLKEDHFRHEGFVFFVHTKFLLIDPLSDDPLVCSGSANFSPGSLLQNDENMLLIRGDTRVADIYL
ncbi:MAG: phospholipase D-like domain-containing protein, partial [Gammaproteobacteria bacterium]